MYKCLNCGRDLTFEDIARMPLKEYAKRAKGPKLRCPSCSSRMFKKLRPDGVKIIKAR